MRHCICYNLLQLQPMKTTSLITPDLAAVHSLDHHHKVIPEGFNRFNPTFLRIYDRQMEVPLFQPHMVYHQTTIFHMEDFHTGTIRIDKNESVTVPYILSHLVGHDCFAGNLFALQDMGSRLQGQVSAIREGNLCGQITGHVHLLPD